MVRGYSTDVKGALVISVEELFVENVSKDISANSALMVI